MNLVAAVVLIGMAFNAFVLMIVCARSSQISQELGEDEFLYDEALNPTRYAPTGERAAPVPSPLARPTLSS